MIKLIMHRQKTFTAVVVALLFQAFARTIPQRVIYTFYHQVELPWNAARDICEAHFGQLIKLENMQQEMEIKLLIGIYYPVRLGTRTIWTGSHLNSNVQLVYQDCLNSTTPMSSTTTNFEACVGANIKVDPSESFVYTSEICSNNYVFICQRTIGDCWYLPIEDKAGSVQNNVITTGPFYEEAVDCAWKCRNSNYSDNSCWAFTYNRTISGCFLHFVNKSVDDAPSLTFLENDNNYAAYSDESILYIRICFEGEVSGEDIDTTGYGYPSDVPSANCSSRDPEPADSLCYCGSDVNPPIPAAIPLADKVEELVRELTISPSNTSAATRKKTCAEDSRPSAAGVGYVGAGLLCSVLGGLLLLDLSTLFQGIQKMRSLFKNSL